MAGMACVLALIAGGLLAARALWASAGLVFIPFSLLYIWLIALSVVLTRRASVSQAIASSARAQGA